MADVNIPVEVFTSPVLEGTNGVLHVSKVYLNELQYRDLEITFSNGMVSEYNCANFERELENKAYIHDNVLYKHPTLPLGEFAIGTNTTAYVTAKKYGIEDKMPILIAEKMGPHLQWEIPVTAGVRISKSITRTEKRSLPETIRYRFAEKKMCQKHISIAIQILRSRMKNWAVLQLLQRIKKRSHY